MSFRTIRITTRALACLWLGAFAATGCAASKAEVRKVKRSGYATDFALVYSETLAVVRTLYPGLTESASIGVIKTAWHPLRIRPDTGDSSQVRRGNPTNLFDATAGADKRYFIRFTVRVVGGNPWRIDIAGQASVWDLANARPSELKGGDEPHWLKGRTNALHMAIHERLKEHAIELKDTPRPQSQTAAAGPDIDPARFGDVPKAAAAVIAAALGAGKARDFVALGATLHPDFVWSLGAPPGARDALVMWQADSSVLGHLVEIIEAGCRTAKDKKRVTCPPAHTETPDYAGYRVGFAIGPEGMWKMTFFVSGR
ncbi:MAG: hypothetical protein MJE77_29765 [Proteobacteria bacterium]|nr:hypothetical protein [Pseudomonadota bacterium]